MAASTRRRYFGYAAARTPHGRHQRSKGYTVLFTRHAESQTNTGGAIGPGQSDLPLTELGQQQAQQLAVTLHDAPINSVNASSMIRAIQTANPTAADHGLQVTTSSQIRELDPNGTVRCDSWFGGTPIA